MTNKIRELEAVLTAVNQATTLVAPIHDLLSELAVRGAYE